MALTLEDRDRRVTVLEKAAETEKNIVRAVSEIVSESEARTKVDITQLRIEMKVEAQRLADRMSDAERRFTNLLNERFDAVVAAIDRFHNPPR